MADPLFFQHCEEVDQFFREGREFFNQTYVKKLAQLSVYFTRCPEATWPLNTGTSQRGFRFGRGFYDPTKPWKQLVSVRCDANSCDTAPERILRPDTESYTWALMKREMMTDWLCVEDLMYRLLPVEEVEQFEESNAIITRSVHEELIRAWYVGSAGHHWGALYPGAGNTFCGPTDDAFWYIPTFDPTVDGSVGYDTRYVYVKCSAANLTNIAELSLDALDDSLIVLGDEDNAYRVDLRDMGILKMDMIVPDPRVARNLYKQAKNSNGWWQTVSDFDKTMTELRLGVPRTIGDYTFSYDNNALKYNVDTAYNDPTTGGANGTGLPTFDPTNTATWPRLVRVMRYQLVKSEIGYKWIPNPAYRFADFGITVHWYADAVTKWRNPSWTGTGSAVIGGQNYAGDFTWRRPDWECNPRGVMGFFLGQFRLAMQVKDPTVVNAYLHRIDQSKSFVAAPCTPQTYTVPPEIEQFVCT